MGIKNVYERFIWFDHQARSKKYPNSTALGKQFEISTKTAQRDIDFMRNRLHCPLRYDKKEKGYYYEDATFSLPMTYLSSIELSSLMIARKMLRDLSGGYLGEELSSILIKITSVLTRHAGLDEKMDEPFTFHMIEYSPTSEKVFRTVWEGCLKRRSLSFVYYSPAMEESRERRVDPYHLLNYMGTWHLIGYCHLRQEIRDFSLSRISEPRLLEGAFQLPVEFDFQEYFLSTFGLYKGKSKEKVTLRFSPGKSKWIKDQIWHKDQKVNHLKDGSMEISFPVSDFSEIQREVLKHGSDVEVIKPKALRRLIKSEAQAIVRKY
jgi:predicted DNA-binding transcriptional regulator YafY